MSQEPLGVQRIVQCAVEQGFDVALDGGDGGLQFMGDVRHEIASDVLQTLELRHVVQHQQAPISSPAALRRTPALHVQAPLLIGVEGEFAGHGCLFVQHLVDQLLQLRAAHRLLQAPPEARLPRGPRTTRRRTG